MIDNQWVELENSKRHMERKQATDWIVDIVCKNINAKAEDDALKQQRHRPENYQLLCFTGKVAGPSTAP